MNELNNIKNKPRPRPKIENIRISKEDLAQLESKVKTTYHKTRDTVMRRYHDVGFCCTCERVALKKVSYDVSDADGSGKVVERYCNDCFKKWIVK